MTQICGVYSQLLQLFPRGQLTQVVKQHQAEFGAKGFTCWEQFMAMLFGQVTHLTSPREVCLGAGRVRIAAETSGHQHSAEEIGSGLCQRQTSHGTLQGDIHVVTGKVPSRDGYAQSPQVSFQE